MDTGPQMMGVLLQACADEGTEQPISSKEVAYLDQLLLNKAAQQPGQPFGCVSCGACCTGADKIPGFALPTKPDGSCINLKGRLCSIYESRPASCHTDNFDFQGRLGLNSLEEWYTVNYAACERLIRIGRIPQANE